MKNVLLTSYTYVPKSKYGISWAVELSIFIVIRINLTLEVGMAIQNFLFIHETIHTNKIGSEDVYSLKQGLWYLLCEQEGYNFFTCLRWMMLSSDNFISGSWSLEHMSYILKQKKSISWVHGGSSCRLTQNPHAIPQWTDLLRNFWMFACVLSARNWIWNQVYPMQWAVVVWLWEN